MWRMRLPAAALSLVASAWAPSGCSECCERGPDPCALDPLDCGSGEPLPAGKDCRDAGEPLQAAIGEGELELELLGPGRAPTFHRGIQLGYHLFLGLRVFNPDPDNAGFEVTFSHAHGDERDHRFFVLGDGLREGPGGSLQQTGFILLTWPGPSGDAGRLELELRDPCDRRATVTHDFEYATDPAP